MFRALRNDTFKIHRPQLGTRIDWNNPITKGLVAYWPILSQSPTLVEVITGAKFNTNGSPTNCSYYRDGYLDCSGNGGGNYGIITAYNQIDDIGLNQPFTLMFRFMFDPTSGNAPGFMGKNNNAGAATAGWNISSTGANGQWKLQVEGSSFPMAAFSTKTFASFQFYNVVVTSKGDGQHANVKWYINGRQDPVDSGSSNNIGGSQASDAGIVMHLGRDVFSNKVGSCKIGNFALWKNRALSAAEGIFLSANPWCMLDPVGNIPLFGKIGVTPLTISSSDTLSLSESQSYFKVGRIIQSDTLSLVDSVFVPTADAQLRITDQIVFTDTLALVLGKGYQNFDIMILLDRLDISAPFFFTKGETLSLTDLALVYPTINRVIDGDTLTFADALTTLIQGVVKVAKVESLNFTDVLHFTLSNFLALSDDFEDNLLITDSFLFKLKASLGVFSDTLTLSDIVKVLAIYNLNKNESVTLSDSVIVSAPEGEGLDDLFSLIDSPRMLLNIVLQASESLSFTDVVSKTINGSKFLLQFSDGLTLSDDPVVLLHVILTTYLRRYLNDVLPN